MSFADWILSRGDNPKIQGQWGPVHIATLVVCIVTIVTLALVFRNKSEKAKRIVLWVLVGFILFFEITRRIINFVKMTDPTFHNIMHTLLPRPWCAIACWSLITSAIVNKKFFYNYAAATALLTSLIYFSYPGAGVNNLYIQFENLYSIATHALLLVTSITLITLKFTKFEYKTIWKEAIALGVVYIYAFIEIWLLKIESDPLYFMPGNDIVGILGVPYPVFLLLYILFVLIFFNTFYLIGDRKNVFKKRIKEKQN